MRPKDVKIITPMNKLSSGKAVEFVCQSTGSKPAAIINWYIGDSLLNGLGSSTSEDGSVTTSFLSFQPNTHHHAKKLTCVTYNPSIRQFILQDGFILHVQCKPNLASLFTVSCPSSSAYITVSTSLFSPNRRTNRISSHGCQFNQQGDHQWL